MLFRTRLFVAAAASIFMICFVRTSAQDLYVTVNGGGVDEYTPMETFVRHFVAQGSGGLTNAQALAFGPDGDLYVANISSGGGSIEVFDGKTGAYKRDVVTALQSANDLAFDPSGNLYVTGNDRIYKIDPNTGTILRTYLTPYTSQGIGFTPDGNLLYSAGNAGQLDEVNINDGTITQFSTGYTSPLGITEGPDGKYYVGGQTPDHTLGSIYVVGSNGGPSTVFATGGTLTNPFHTTFDLGDLYVASYVNSTLQRYDGLTGAFVSSIPVTAILGITTAPTPASTPEPGAFSLIATMFLSSAAVFGRKRLKCRIIPKFTHRPHSSHTHLSEPPASSIPQLYQAYSDFGLRNRHS